MSETATMERPASVAGRPSSAKLAWIEKTLGVRPASPAASATPRRDVSMVTLQKARLAWDGLRKSIQSQLQSLETAIVSAVEAHNNDPAAPDRFDPAAVATGAKKLYGLLDGLDARLIDALDDALNAAGEERNAHHDKARTIIGEYKAFLAENELIKLIDKNGFIPTAIRPTVEKTLTALDQVL